MPERDFPDPSLTSLSQSLAQGGTTDTDPGAVFIERNRPGKPHRGKMLAAIQPHSDDIPIQAAGTVLKLLSEGYRGILIKTCTDEETGSGQSTGEIVLNNERDTHEVARRMGLEKVFLLNYSDHRIDDAAELELRARLVFIFRLMCVDTVLCYDPWGRHEGSPDQIVTARSVESACWMAGCARDYPEHFEAGLRPHTPQEKYYFSRNPSLVNRVVDIGSYMNQKVFVNLANVTRGPAGSNGARLRQWLIQLDRKLPILGDDDETANRQYAKHFALRRDHEQGKNHGLYYAECFRYNGPETSIVGDYVEKNAVTLAPRQPKAWGKAAGSA